MRGVVMEAVLGWWTRKARQRHLCPFIKKPVFSVQHCDVCSLVPNTVQESSVPIMSADVFELLIVKKQVSLVVSLPFYIQLSAHLQLPQEDISTELFTKVLSCSASELSERLSLNQPAKRVREVAQQLFDGGFKAAAGSLVLSTQQFHPNTLTVSDGVTYVNRLMRR